MVGRIIKLRWKYDKIVKCRVRAIEIKDKKKSKGLSNYGAYYDFRWLTAAAKW